MAHQSQGDSSSGKVHVLNVFQNLGVIPGTTLHALPHPRYSPGGS